MYNITTVVPHLGFVLVHKIHRIRNNYYQNIYSDLKWCHVTYISH
jgi:hypothetical protein